MSTCALAFLYGVSIGEQLISCRVWSNVAVRSQLRVSGRLSVKPIVLAVGGLSLVVIVVATWIVVSRCRAAAAARQSNLEDKTARSLTKSNSYKSSPSGTPTLQFITVQYLRLRAQNIRLQTCKVDMRL